MVARTGQDLTPQLTGAVKERIKELILGNTIVIFSKSYCPFCMKVKALFAQLGAQQVYFIFFILLYLFYYFIFFTTLS